MFNLRTRDNFQWRHIDQTLYSCAWIDNFVVQASPSNFSQNPNLLLRDSHVNDFYDGQLCMAWSANPGVTDPATNNTLNLYFAKFTRTENKRKQHQHNPDIPAKAITYFNEVTNAASLMFDTAVAINRKDAENIVASTSFVLATDLALTYLMAYVSHNGGKEFSEPITVATAPGALDCRGPLADKYGNFLYSGNFANNASDGALGILNLHFFASSDGGKQWNQIFQTNVENPATYDYPQLQFGVSNKGQYGAVFFANLFPVSFEAGLIGVLGFIPIHGRGKFGPVQLQYLNDLPNLLAASQPALSSDGMLYLTSVWSENAYYHQAWSNNLASTKLNHGICDPQDHCQKQKCPSIHVSTVTNSYQNIWFPLSYPSDIFFSQSVQGIVVDRFRQNTLYVAYTSMTYIAGNDYSLFLLISTTKEERGPDAFLLPILPATIADTPPCG